MTEWSEQYRIWRGATGNTSEPLGETPGLERGDDPIEVVPKLEAEQQIDNAFKQGADQERQRLKEALERVDSFWPEQVTARTDEQDQWIRRKEALAALDTLEADRG